MQRYLTSPGGGAARGDEDKAAPQRAGASGQWRVLAGVAPYVWPADRPDLQATVVLSLAADAAGEARHRHHAVHVQVGDGRAGGGGGRQPCRAGQTLAGWSARRCWPRFSTALTRIAMTLLVQVREGMFAKVAMHAVRKLALNTFEHMHRLSLRFHLERKTGGLTRVLERGRAGIENITRMTLMTFVPTIVEFALVLAVLRLRVRLALCRRRGGDDRRSTCGFTVRATDWRIKIRRTMNESDTEANTKAIDSLLNYETVKYFGAEEREAQRYDQSMAVYEQASVKSYTSLAVLNGGQAVDLHRSR